MTRDILLLSTADWDNPFWTNKQHVACELSQLGYRILYVESLGLRRPSADARDLRRIVRRIWRCLSSPRRGAEGVWVGSPLVLPFQRFAAVRWFNRWLLSAQIMWWRLLLRHRPDMLWTYNPLTLEFLRPPPGLPLVYHCVDEIGAQPGMPTKAIEAHERQLCEAADMVFVTALGLQERRAGWCRRIEYLPNVADDRHFGRAMAEGRQVPADLEAIPGPRIGFIGAISSYKLDFALIAATARLRPDWSFVLIGQVGEGDPATEVSLLRDLPNLHLLGPRPYDSLPDYLRGMAVAWLPNRLNDYTDGMFPMKFAEYLAAGRPVVSVPLPALRDYAAVCAFAADAGSTVTAMAAILAGGAPPLEQRLTVAAGHTYRVRTRRMLDLLRDRCGWTGWAGGPTPDAGEPERRP